jgi:prepilin-type N-terminal cleavage/methylation domain-containing protein
VSRIHELKIEFKILGKLVGKSKGFTLVEIIIVIVILSLISVITIKFLIDSLKIYTMSANQQTIYEEAKLALERMCRDIRDAKTITTPISGGSGNTIVFQRTNPTGGDSSDENLTYRLNGNRLEKVKTSPSVTSLLASNVSSFLVTRETGGNDEITLQLTLSLNTGENITLQTKVYPKNLSASSIYKNFFGNWKEDLSS